jgi:aryl-alcohol dehydrogenase-like predicted oxidoreductase
MNFGENWKAALGECGKETAFEMLDYFYAAGGNFIDTAVNYQDGESEAWLGEWMAERGTRDEMVVATKFTGSVASSEIAAKGRQVLHSNFGGNGKKAMVLSVEKSLKRLKTTYIDLVSSQPFALPPHRTLYSTFLVYE